MAIIIDLRGGMPTGPGPRTNYVAGCPHCDIVFKLDVPLFEFKSEYFDAWIADCVKHRAACKRKASVESGLNEAGKHFLGLNG